MQMTFKIGYFNMHEKFMNYLYMLFDKLLFTTKPII